MLPYNLDHVAIAVHDLDEAIDRFGGRYGVLPLHREVVASQGVEEAMLPVGGSFLQLVQPLDPDTAVGRFLATRGEGMHHVALAVPDIDAALSHLADEGARLIDETARPGGRGARIAFVHPKDFAGTLVELVELPGADPVDGPLLSGDAPTREFPGQGALGGDAATGGTT